MNYWNGNTTLNYYNLYNGITYQIKLAAMVNQFKKKNHRRIVRLLRQNMKPACLGGRLGVISICPDFDLVLLKNYYFNFV